MTSKPQSGTRGGTVFHPDDDDAAATVVVPTILRAFRRANQKLPLRRPREAAMTQEEEHDHEAAEVDSTTTAAASFHALRSRREGHGTTDNNSHRSVTPPSLGMDQRGGSSFLVLQQPTSRSPLPREIPPPAPTTSSSAQPLLPTASFREGSPDPAGTSSARMALLKSASVGSHAALSGGSRKSRPSPSPEHAGQGTEQLIQDVPGTQPRRMGRPAVAVATTTTMAAAVAPPATVGRTTRVPPATARFATPSPIRLAMEEPLTTTQEAFEVTEGYEADMPSPPPAFVLRSVSPTPVVVGSSARRAALLAAQMSSPSSQLSKGPGDFRAIVPPRKALFADASAASAVLPAATGGKGTWEQGARAYFQFIDSRNLSVA